MFAKGQQPANGRSTRKVDGVCLGTTGLCFAVSVGTAQSPLVLKLDLFWFHG